MKLENTFGDEVIYKDPKSGCWVRLHAQGMPALYWHGSTNSDLLWEKCAAELTWKGSKVEAQTDLNNFALRHNLVPVGPKEYQNRYN